MSSGLFFNRFQKLLSGKPFEYQTDLAQHYVRTDLDPNVLQRLAADNTICKELSFETAC